MKIAVTGATGQLGCIVINQLKETNEKGNIVALARSPQKATGMGVDVRVADYNNPVSLNIALMDIATLVFISGSEVGQRIPQHTNIIEAAKQAGVRRIVYTSLLHVDTTSLSISEEHIVTETLLKNAGIPFTILRNGWYTENYENSVMSGLKANTFIGSACDGKISSAARRDYAEAIVAVLSSGAHHGKIYELAGDESFSLSDLAAEVSVQSGKLISYTNLSSEEYVTTLLKAGLPHGVAEMLAGIDVSTSKGDLFDDSHQLSNLIGRPTTPLSDVVKDFLKQA